MQLTTILYIILVAVAVVAILSGLLALINFNWLIMAMCWTIGIACILTIGYLEGEL